MRAGGGRAEIEWDGLIDGLIDSLIDRPCTIGMHVQQHTCRLGHFTYLPGRSDGAGGSHHCSERRSSKRQQRQIREATASTAYSCRGRSVGLIVRKGEPKDREIEVRGVGTHRHTDDRQRRPLLLVLDSCLGLTRGVSRAPKLHRYRKHQQA